MLQVPNIEEAVTEDPSLSIMDFINENSEKLMNAVIEPFIQEDVASRG